MSTPLVHRPDGVDGGDRLVVESGGEIEVKAGGDISVDGESLAGVTTLIAAIPESDPEDGETIWNDNGVLKVASESGGGD